MGFTRQPQFQASIDWSNPLARGMAALFNPASQSNAVTGGGCAVLGTPAKYVEMPLGGVALRVDGTNDAWTSGGAYKGSGTDITMFAFARLNTTGVSRTILGTSNSSNAGVRIEWSASLGRVVFTKGGVVNISAGAGMQMDVEVPYFFGVSYKHSSGLTQFYLKNLSTGVVQTSTATNTSSWSAGDGVFGYGGGQWSASTTWSGGLGLAGVAMRDMSLTELAALAANPWQIFKAPQRAMFVPAAASIAHQMTAAPGVFVLSGKAASLKAARRLLAAQGAVASTGGQVALRAARRVSAEHHAFALTGVAAALRAARAVRADPGALIVAGQGVALAAARRIAVAPAAFALTGHPVVLLYTPIMQPGGPTYELVLAPRSMALVGLPVNLAAGRRIAATSGSFAMQGQVAAMRAARTISAQAGSYAVLGAAVNLKYGLDQIDASKVPPSRTVVFAGNTRIVSFAGAYRVTTFNGSIKKVKF